MKSIAIVIAENAVVSGITDTIRLFDKANELLQARGTNRMFDVSLVGFSREIFVGNKNLFFRADKTLGEIVNADLIIIPALAGDIIKSTQQNRHYFPWLIKQYKQGAEIASYCVGAFILAATGLLNGKKCATHWMYSNEFRFYYPNVTLVDDRIITEQNGIYTSGGGTSYWNLEPAFVSA
jgi:transcriptional regulator GlxA family with amidase domain